MRRGHVSSRENLHVLGGRQPRVPHEDTLQVQREAACQAWRGGTSSVWGQQAAMTLEVLLTQARRPDLFSSGREIQDPVSHQQSSQSRGQANRGERCAPPAPLNSSGLQNPRQSVQHLESGGNRNTFGNQGEGEWGHTLL